MQDGIVNRFILFTIRAKDAAVHSFSLRKSIDLSAGSEDIHKGHIIREHTFQKHLPEELKGFLRQTMLEAG
jgi:hypothetical protein